MTANITFFDVTEDQYLPLRRALYAYPFWEVRLVGEPLRLANAALAQNNAVISIAAGTPVTAELLDKLPALRLVATRSSNCDHIDLDAAAQRGVAVCHAPENTGLACAEYAFGLLIALMRRLPATLQRCQSGNFSRAGLTGGDLQGKALGLLGTDSSAAHMMRFANAFGMRVIVCDPMSNLAPRQDDGVVYLDVEDFLPEADALSIHLPYHRATHHLLDETRLRMLKPGSMLINVSHGGIIDSRALARLQAEGHFGGLALDCFEGDTIWLNAQAPLPRGLPPHHLEQALHNFQLQLSDNVILTPHNANNSHESLNRSIATTLDNIAAFFAGKPRNLATTPPD
ncbi:MAG: hydroxyacid dehydrogenase [Gammaproteobacteria bacterium]|nr:hydroxyacid dehydrogenase [Gammaproteobacteria bacterium]